MAHDLLNFSDRITAVPVIHGSGDFAVEIRRIMLAEKFDCLAVPLPPSFKSDVERAIGALPLVSIVGQLEPTDFAAEGDGDGSMNFGPVDPCQPVIAAIRVAMGERMVRQYVDLEVERFEAYSGGFPDPYALKKLPLERFVAAVLPAIPRVPEGQARERVAHMAGRLVELETKYKSILFVCSMLDWPWVREAYNELKGEASLRESRGEAAGGEETAVYQPNEKNLLFSLGELPFITGLYEQARAELDDDENLSIDGVKELLMTARDRYQADLKKQARPITPQLLSLLLKYVRNLSLVERRLTPDLYTLAVGAQQFAGDPFALHVVETARSYPFNGRTEWPAISMGMDEARLPDGGVVRTVNRLAGPPIGLRRFELDQPARRPQPE